MDPAPFGASTPPTVSSLQGRTNPAPLAGWAVETRRSALVRHLVAFHAHKAPRMNHHHFGQTNAFLIQLAGMALTTCLCCFSPVLPWRATARSNGSVRTAKVSAVRHDCLLEAEAGMRGQGQAPQQDFTELGTRYGRPSKSLPLRAWSSTARPLGGMPASLRQLQRSGCDRLGNEMHLEGALIPNTGGKALPTAQAVTRLVWGTIWVNQAGRGASQNATARQNSHIPHSPAEGQVVPQHWLIRQAPESGLVTIPLPRDR